MLLALEGGGFFSSSASGYRKGLSVLLLGQKRKNEEEKLMRVSPWNHNYQLVEKDREPESDLQLASKKNRRLVRGCTSFVCFGRTTAGLESPNSLKVGPTKQKDDIVSEPIPVQTKDDVVVGSIEEDVVTKPGLKSSLKRPVISAGTDQHEETLGLRHTEKRKVQWTDASGGELAEIREFEPSDVDGSDDEFNSGMIRSCSCTIM